MRHADFVSRIQHHKWLSFLISFILVAPFGFGIPYLIGETVSAGAGIGILLLFLGPSVVAAAWVAKLFGHKLSPAVYGIGGFCVAPLLELLTLVTTFVAMDWTCEGWSIGCDLAAIWQVTGLLWSVLIFACLATAAYLEDHTHTEPS